MNPDTLKAWLSLGATILAAGIWLGSLQQRVVELEKKSVYLHGEFIVPPGASK